MNIEQAAHKHLTRVKADMMPYQVPPESFGIIEKLLLELRCLRIQVVDRGVSYTRAVERIAVLETALSGKTQFDIASSTVMRCAEIAGDLCKGGLFVGVVDPVEEFVYSGNVRTAILKEFKVID